MIMRVIVACFVLVGCGGYVDLSSDEASTPLLDGSEPSLDDLPDAKTLDASVPDSKKCVRCPSSAPMVGAACDPMAFCEYEPNVSLACEDTCQGWKWGVHLLNDAGADASFDASDCPHERPKMGSPCDAGFSECPLGAHLVYSSFNDRCLADTYACRCGQWQPVLWCIPIGAPPPC
jgi:hypothetical protein